MAAKNTPKGLFSCDFELHGKVPKEAFELFALAQAKAAHIRGYIVQVSSECYRGIIQGQSDWIELFRQLLEKATEVFGAIKEIIVKNIKQINAYTYEKFEIRQQ